LQNFALQPMEISKRYNSVSAKDNNCALFAPTLLIRAAAARLHGVAMGQIPRSTERIFSFE